MKGEAVKISEIKGENHATIFNKLLGTNGIFLSFFPHLDTPVSRFQLQNIRETYSKIRDKGYDVIVVTLKETPDIIKNQKMPFTIINDLSGTLAETFNVLRKGLSGITCLRRTFFILPNCKVFTVINDIEAILENVEKYAIDEQQEV